MNKKCSKCNASVPSDANFCPVCGSSDFAEENSSTNQADLNQNQPPVTPTCDDNPWQSPAPQYYQPKKKKTGLIIGIVAAVLIVLAIIGAVAEKVYQKQGYGTDSSDKSSYSSDAGKVSSIIDSSSDSKVNSSKAEYTKGTFDGTVYKNTWADIEFELPEGFSDGDSSLYSASENSVTDCGLYFMADDTMSLIYICYEKLPTTPVYDEEAYLDAVMKNFDSLTALEYQTTDTYSTAKIGGYKYLKAECEVNNGIADFSNTVYVRKLDGYMICISVIGADHEANADLVSNITQVK